MSKPLHYKRRFFISLVFIILFLIFIPVILLYSIGYRLDKDFSLTPTGGLYVFYPESGAEVYINDTLSDQTSLFERGIFIDDLSPSTLSIEIKKSGYIPWKKNIEIRKKRVAEAYPYLIPQTIATSSVPRFITLGSGTSVTSVTNTLYGTVAKLFATSSATTTTAAILKNMKESTSTPLIASSTGIIKKSIEIEVIGNQIIASWKGNKDSTPFYFCDADRLICETNLIVAQGNIKHVDFYPGRNDVVIYSTKEGIFATELDQRDNVNIRKLLSGNLDFRQDDQRIFVKDKVGYYELLFTASSSLINPISI